MPKNLISAGAAVVLALFLSGCETDAVAVRAQEKSAVYAALTPWQKKNLDRGSVAQGFSPDMVYIAVGSPDRVETKEFPEGPAELWTYTRYYPKPEALRGLKRVTFTLDSAYHPQLVKAPTGAEVYARGPTSPTAALSTDQNRGQIGAKTGSVQGSSMEPADLSSYTLKVLFAGGSVVKVGADPNAN